MTTDANPSRWPIRQAILHHLTITSDLAGCIAPDGRPNGDADDLRHLVERFEASYGRVMPLVTNLVYQEMTGDTAARDDETVTTGWAGDRLRDEIVDGRPYGAGSGGT